MNIYIYMYKYEAYIACYDIAHIPTTNTHSSDIN